MMTVESSVQQEPLRWAFASSYESDSHKSMLACLYVYQPSSAKRKLWFEWTASGNMINPETILKFLKLQFRTLCFRVPDRYMGIQHIWTFSTCGVLSNKNEVHSGLFWPEVAFQVLQTIRIDDDETVFSSKNPVHPNLRILCKANMIIPTLAFES